MAAPLTSIITANGANVIAYNEAYIVYAGDIVFPSLPSSSSVISKIKATPIFAVSEVAFQSSPKTRLAQTHVSQVS